tara:strand:- start:55 stop:591 length:537 start_codon:yes stop_codon:yes gene_type:complete
MKITKSQLRNIVSEVLQERRQSMTDRAAERAKGTSVGGSDSEPKSGEEQPAEQPEEQGEEQEKGKPGLKKLDKGTVNVALNQLRNKGIGAKKLRQAIVKAIKDIHKAAGPQRKEFAKKDAPVINQIGKELVKILSGDFSNLVKESQEKFYYVTPLAYSVIKLLAEEKQPVKIYVRGKK